MREIKFRAWDRHNKRMYVFDDVGFFDKELGDVTFIKNIPDMNDKESVCCFGGWGELDGDELMQFTGLKDKNGKEIYDGDVVKPEWQLKEEVCEVKFESGKFTIEHGSSIDDIDWWSDCEVIGNIYESPGLLQ